jgi:hypothetical protein
MTVVKRIAAGMAIGAAALIDASLSTAPPAQAGYIVALTQQGTSVVATGSGPIDLTGLSSIFAISSSPGINPQVAFIATGMSAPIDDYIGVTGPASFGPGRPPPDRSLIAADSGSGDIVSLIGDSGTLAVPSGYVSGNPLSDTATYLDQSFASLGVTPGTYEWTWGTGVNQNFTLVIGTAAIPEPSSLPSLGAGVITLLLVSAYRSRPLPKFSK